MKKIIYLTVSVLILLCVMNLSVYAGDYLGDVNRDGKVSASDARTVLRAAAKLEALDSIQMFIADVNVDGKINASDARHILRCSAKLEYAGAIFIDYGPQEPGTGESESDVAYPAVIDSLFSDEFYFKTSEGSDGDVIEMEFAVIGDEVEIVMSTDGLSLPMYLKDGSIYLKFDYNGTLTYCIVTQDVMSSMGMDVELSDVVLAVDFGTRADYVSVSCYKEELDGASYSVYAFATDDGETVCFYADEDDNIKSFARKDADGNVTAYMTVDSISDEIPENMCTVDGYTKGNYAMFLYAMAIDTEK